MKYIQPNEQGWDGPMIPDWLAKRKEVSVEAKTLWAQLWYDSKQEDREARQNLAGLAERLGATEESVCAAVDELRAHKLVKARFTNGNLKVRFLNHKWADFEIVRGNWLPSDKQLQELKRNASNPMLDIDVCWMGGWAWGRN